MPHSFSHRKPLLCLTSVFKPDHFSVRWLWCDHLTALLLLLFFFYFCFFSSSFNAEAWLFLPSLTSHPPMGANCNVIVWNPVCTVTCPSHRLDLYPQEHVEEGRVLRDQPHRQQNQGCVQEHDHGGSDAAVLRRGGGRGWFGEHDSFTCWRLKQYSLSPHEGVAAQSGPRWSARGWKLPVFLRILNTDVPHICFDTIRPSWYMQQLMFCWGQLLIFEKSVAVMSRESACLNRFTAHCLCFSAELMYLIACCREWEF